MKISKNRLKRIIVNEIKSLKEFAPTRRIAPVPSIDINDLLNREEETDDEEREKKRIPVYCIKCEIHAWPDGGGAIAHTYKGWYVFKSKSAMIKAYEDELITEFMDKTAYLEFANDHPLVSEVNKSKISNWAGCERGSSISFEDYSNCFPEEWDNYMIKISEAYYDFIEVGGEIALYKYMSDEPDVIEYPC